MSYQYPITFDEYFNNINYNEPIFNYNDYNIDDSVIYKKESSIKPNIEVEEMAILGCIPIHNCIIEGNKVIINNKKKKAFGFIKVKKDGKISGGGIEKKADKNRSNGVSKDNK